MMIIFMLLKLYRHKSYKAIGASLVAQRIKHLPAVQETWVQFLGWEDHLEKEMTIQSSIFAWTIPWIREPGGLQSMGSVEDELKG